MPSSFVTVGTFDGVHLGHRRIIALAVREALRRGMDSRVAYFPFPPKFFFSGEMENCLITLPEEREELIESLRPDMIEPLVFNKAVASMPASVFFSEVILGRFTAGGLCVGPDFAVGRGREGHLDFLRRASREAGLAFRAVPFARRGGHRVSSSLVRSLLREGKVKEANSCLGWNYSVSGTVEAGAGLGRKMGFPTANIAAHPSKILPPGVFAARVKVGRDTYDAAVFVGRRSTVRTLRDRVILEAHILGFSGSIRGRRITATFLKHIRPERRFSSKETLAERIKSDLTLVRRYLARR